MEKYFIYKIFDQMFATPINHIESIEKITKITAIPLQSKEILGMASIRNKLFTVINTAEILSIQKQEENSEDQNYLVLLDNKIACEISEPSNIEEVNPNEFQQALETKIWVRQDKQAIPIYDLFELTKSYLK